MNTEAAPEVEKGGGGCCGLGCLTIVLLVGFFAFALVAGGFWALHHLKTTYTSAQSIPMPEDLSSESSVPVDGSTTASGVAAATPVPVKQVETEWKSFEKAGDRGEKKRIELTAGEINTLLANSKNTRGKVYVWIENNVGKVRVSIPIKNVPTMNGRYLNGEATVTASPDGDPNKAEISNIVLSNQTVPASVLDQRFFGASSLRGTIGNWLNKQNVETFRIENNRVVGETRGQ